MWFKYLCFLIFSAHCAFAAHDVNIDSVNKIGGRSVTSIEINNFMIDSYDALGQKLSIKAERAIGDPNSVLELTDITAHLVFGEVSRMLDIYAPKATLNSIHKTITLSGGVSMNSSHDGSFHTQIIVLDFAGEFIAKSLGSAQFKNNDTIILADFFKINYTTGAALFSGNVKATLNKEVNVHNKE